MCRFAVHPQAEEVPRLLPLHDQEAVHVKAQSTMLSVSQCTRSSTQAVACVYRAVGGLDPIELNPRTARIDSSCVGVNSKREFTQTQRKSVSVRLRKEFARRSVEQAKSLGLQELFSFQCA